MTPELRARLLEWLPASMVDAPDAYPPGYDGPLDERTPGLVRIPGLRAAIERAAIRDDRERLIDEARD